MHVTTILIANYVYNTRASALFMPEFAVENLL